MIKTAISFVVAIFISLAYVGLAGAVETAPIASIKYIHDYVKQKWDIDIPYNSELENPHVAANMTYLLTVVDVANRMRNGFQISSYGTGPYATRIAVNTNTAVKAIDTLVRLVDTDGFWYTVSGNVTTPTFDVKEGTFTIDWGDGESEYVVHTPADDPHVAYPHVYKDGKTSHTVRIRGRATKYVSLADKSQTPPAAIQFWSTTNDITAIGGCLGCVFPTIGDGEEDEQQPTFYRAFYNKPQIKEIPYGFFNGIHGRPSHGMFHSMFQQSGIETIPSGLFANISGSAAGVANTFRDTFNNCVNLTSIPVNLFGDITDVDNREFFWAMFYGDINVRGPAPKINGKYLWELWPSLNTQMFTRCNLDEQNQMPTNWKN